MSWSRSKAPPFKGPVDPVPALPSPRPPPEPPQHAPQTRSRAMTTSTYASTATPPTITDDPLQLASTADLGDLFTGMPQRRSTMLEADAHAPAMPSKSRANPPNSLTIDAANTVEPPLYSWSSQHSHDRLMSTPSPTSPVARKPTAMPARAPSSLSTLSSAARHPEADPAERGLRRTSAVPNRRQSTLHFPEGPQDDARLLQDSINAYQSLSPAGHAPDSRPSWEAPSSPPGASDVRSASPPRVPIHDMQPKASNDSIFDAAMLENAGLALRFEEHAATPSPPMPAVHKFAPKNKVMTPAQFEKYRQEQATLKALGGSPKLDDNDADENYEEEEDEADKNRRIAKQRRQQEAHMSVYRQQMMKVTGETIPPPRPQMLASQSTPNLILEVPGDAEDEDEDIPLGILAAHGFPNKNKPPNRLSTMGSNPNLRGAAATGSGGRLPAFARHLPQDPYIGASLVHPSNRESLAFSNSGPPSVYGGPHRSSTMPTLSHEERSRASIIPPGGLVGVIANEERSRAMRRGSPNAQGEFPLAPPPQQHALHGMGMPQMPSLLQQQMLTPGDQAQIQMSQQMSQFMQMQMQFMQMMASSGQNANMTMPGMPMPGPTSPGLGDVPRATARSIRPSMAARPATMLEANTGSWGVGSMFAPSIFNGAQPGYSASIAPSERSNVGMPGRYRPVSQAPPAVMLTRGSRTSTMMSGALPLIDSARTPLSKTAPVVTVRPTATIKKVEPTDDDEDDEGWHEMAKKREKKRSIWRKKRDTTSGMQDILAFAES